jgi:hypothetical protein
MEKRMRRVRRKELQSVMRSFNWEVMKYAYYLDFGDYFMGVYIFQIVKTYKHIL